MQLRAFVAKSGTTHGNQCWGCNVAFDDSGFCDEWIPELQEQCVQDDMRLASYAASLLGPCTRQGLVNHVKRTMLLLVRTWTTEQLLEHQGVACVAKLLNTDGALPTESGQKGSVRWYLKLRQKAVLPSVELDSIESDSLQHEGRSQSEAGRNKTNCVTSTRPFDVMPRCMICCHQLHQRPRSADCAS